MCSWTFCGTVLVLLAALLLSPKVTPPNFFDDAFEGLFDTLDTKRAVMPLVDGDISAPWTDILQARPPFCPVVYKSCAVAHSFAPRSGDVVISTAPKTGTTLLQQVTHQLRSGGDMNFTDIYDVQPWILVNPLYRGDAGDVPQPWSPRVFKNHQSIAEFRGGRHIVTVRDPVKTFESWYQFGLAKELPFFRHNAYLHIVAGLLGMPSIVAEWWLGNSWKDPTEFARMSLGWGRDMAFGMNYYQYMAEFWLARRDPNVLLLVYEELVREPARWIPVIGEFMGVDVTPELVKRVVEMSSKEFMMDHISKFDESSVAPEINNAGKLTVPWGIAPKVRSEMTTRGLPSECESVLQRGWEVEVKPSTGFNTYAEMRAAWLSEMAN